MRATCLGTCLPTALSASLLEARAGIAWDWAEVEPRVLAIDNPLAIQTNIELLTAPGQEPSPYLLLRSLHVIVHGLPWQSNLLEQFTPPTAR